MRASRKNDALRSSAKTGRARHRSGREMAPGRLDRSPPATAKTRLQHAAAMRTRRLGISGADRVSFGQQAATGTDREASAEPGGAALEQRRPLARGAEADLRV